MTRASLASHWRPLMADFVANVGFEVVLTASADF
jgi:hypothetical protein